MFCGAVRFSTRRLKAEFDDIVTLAAQMSLAPLAWLGLVDEKRVFFKARHNFAPRELPRDGLPCAQTILEDDLLIVRDLDLDPRFDALEINGQKVRFYAGAPLITHDGYAPLGTSGGFGRRAARTRSSDAARRSARLGPPGHAATRMAPSRLRKIALRRARFAGTKTKKIG